jgi:hypothetical protein
MRSLNRRVAIHQQLHHHPRVEGAIAASIPFIALVERTQVEGVDRIRDEVRQMIFRQPVPRRRGEQKSLVQCVRKCRWHRRYCSAYPRFLPRRLLDAEDDGSGQRRPGRTEGGHASSRAPAVGQASSVSSGRASSTAHVLRADKGPSPCRSALALLVGADLLSPLLRFEAVKPPGG